MHAHFIPNTHLDREWSMDFQHSRKMTVDFLDDLLEIMAKIPEYAFLLDAQAVPLEDYLEIRPEHREILSQYIKSGRLNAGPWYTALDMNCINGESVVRNMHWGHLLVEEMGPVMKVGYTPFGWGQVSQLPQIYKGFGIEMSFFYRGITKEQVPKSEFIWQGADGTQILTSRFGSGARYNFYFDVWRKAFYEGMQERIGRRYHWNQDGVPFKLCDSDHRYNHGYVVPEKKPLQLEVLKRCFRELVEKEKKIFGTDEFAFMHGMDTSSPDMREAEILTACQQELAEGETFTYSSLPKYAEKVRAAVKLETLPIIQGEVRHTKLNEYGFSYIANDIISARTRQKYALAETENRLIRLAEPHATMAWLLGETWPGPFLAIAWKQYLKCHPHDTVGGCGIDTLEEDALYRLRDAKSLANMISSESLKLVQNKIDTSAFGKNALVLTVYNPSAYPRTQCVEAYVDIPREMELKNMGVYDMVGQRMNCAIAPTQSFDKIFRDHSDLALMSYTDEHLVKFDAIEVPAMGYASYCLRSGPTLTAEIQGNLSPYRLENNFLLAEINSDGTVNLTDKTSEQHFSGLNYFEDVGEIGHCWTHLSPKAPAITTQGQKAQLAWVENNSVSQSLQALLTIKIPKQTPLAENRLDWTQAGRPEADTEMPIEVIYRLNHLSRSLEVEVKFNNTCENHRLRAILPSHINSEKSYAESVFDVVERHTRKSTCNPYHEAPYLNYPFVRFAGIQEGQRNLSLICSGLKEYEILDDREQSLAITLMRAYTNNLCTAGDYNLEHRPGPLAQAQGQHSFKYHIYTGPTGSDFTTIYQEAEAESAPMVVAETKSSTGTLPPNHSFLSVNNKNLIVSAIKKASRTQQLIIRLFNASSTEQKGCLTLTGQAPSRAEMVNLNEESTGIQLSVVGENIQFSAGAKKIVTLAITL